MDSKPTSVHEQPDWLRVKKGERMEFAGFIVGRDGEPHVGDEVRIEAHGRVFTARITSIYKPEWSSRFEWTAELLEVVQ